MVEARDACALAAELFAGLFRASGKPFVSHLVGTASVLVRGGAPIATVKAGLLHAAYVQGAFGDGPPGRTPRRARSMTLAIGAESEALVARYTTFPWNPHAPPDPALISSLDEVDRAVVLMRLANEVDDFADGGVRLHADGAARARHASRALPAWIASARALGSPEIAAALERLELADALTPLPAELCESRVRSFRPRPPLSHDAGSRLRSALALARAARRFAAARLLRRK